MNETYRSVPTYKELQAAVTEENIRREQIALVMVLGEPALSQYLDMCAMNGVSRFPEKEMKLFLMRWNAIIGLHTIDNSKGNILQGRLS